MNLPRPSDKYDATNEAQTRGTLETADGQNMKKTADVAIIRRRLILQSPNGSLFSIVVSNAGALSATAL